MKIVVSFCNQHHDQSNLVMCDLDTRVKKDLFFGDDSFTGITQDGKHIYAISQKNKIIVISKERHEIIIEQELPELSEAHSVAVNGNELYVVSTGNDKLLAYRCDLQQKKISYTGVAWQPVGSAGEGDTHHINAVFFREEHLYISAFGKKEGDKWSSAKNGYIFDVTDDQVVYSDIYHPHSVFVSGNDFYCCESVSRSVKKNGKVMITLNKGYVRGLCIADEIVIIGTSSGRKVSKSSGTVNNPADPGELEEDCRVVLFKKNIFGRYRIVDYVDFFPHYTEIYDIMVLEK